MRIIVHTYTLGECVCFMLISVKIVLYNVTDATMRLNHIVFLVPFVKRNAGKSTDENSQMQGMLRFYYEKGNEMVHVYIRYIFYTLHLSSLSLSLSLVLLVFFSLWTICNKVRLYIKFGNCFSSCNRFWL